jgi:hypothetical protein
MTRTAANLPTPIRTDVFHGLDASSPQQTFPAAEGAEGAAGAKVGGDYNLPSQMREKRGHLLLPPSMGRRDGPTGGGAYHVGTLQRHYKKISDPLEEIYDLLASPPIPNRGCVNVVVFITRRLVDIIVDRTFAIGGPATTASPPAPSPSNVAIA